MDFADRRARAQRRPPQRNLRNGNGNGKMINMKTMLRILVMMGSILTQIMCKVMMKIIIEDLFLLQTITEVNISMKSGVKQISKNYFNYLE